MALKVNPWFVECGGTVPIGAELPDQTGNINQVLHTDGNNTYWAFVNYDNLLNTPSLGSSYTFSNGITNTADVITLGGELTEGTTTFTGANEQVIFAMTSDSRVQIDTVLYPNNVIQLGTSFTTLTDTRGTPTGLQYTADYSVNFTDHSLVTKKWVTDNFSTGGGTTYTASLPIEITADDIALNYLSTQFQLSGDSLALKFGITGGISAEGDHTHSTYALTAHVHDDRYYTDTELQTDGFAYVHWGNIESTPTTLIGYGITDAAPISHVGTGGGAHDTVTLSVDGFMDHVSYYQLTRDVLRKAKIILTTTTWDWNFNLGFNAEGTPTGNTALNMTNVETGDYGTIVILNSAASYELTLPTGSIQIDGNGTTVQLTGSSAKDLLSFYYNGVNYFWSVTTNYS